MRNLCTISAIVSKEDKKQATKILTKIRCFNEWFN